jgi:ribosomal protein S18 acetylase RimI-like enzyme
MDRLFPALQLQWLAVHNNHQGKGIGTIIMGRVIETFVESVVSFGVPVMTLVAANPRVAAFYRRLGFVQYGGASSPRMLLPAQSALELQTTQNNP